MSIKMTNEQFSLFLSSAMDDLWKKQNRLKDEYGFGSFSRWLFDQDDEQLDLFDANNDQVLSAKVIIIGSYTTDRKTWKWGWSNESLLQNLRDKAESLKALKDITGISIFDSDEHFPLENEQMAWELAAMSIRQLDALGVYKAAYEQLSVFMAIVSLNKNN